LFNDTHSSLILTLAGVAFFVYGIGTASENLQKLAANRIRLILGTLSRRPLWGVFFGISLTMILQSSGAVISMLVGLGSARVISLAQVMSLILGSAIGSTFTVQILSFDVARYGLPLFAVSFFFFFLSKKRAFRTTMGAIMGFGLLFWGLELIRIGTEGLSHFQQFGGFLQILKENPLYALGLTAALTAVVQSSAVTIGLAMTLASHGLISLPDSIYWIFGANIGTTATALIASTGGNYVGRQVAWAHCFYKLAGVAVFYPFSKYLVEWIATGTADRDVANINTVYNLLAAMIFYPGIKQGAALVEKWFPPSDSEKEYSVKFLKKDDWQSPSVAIAHAERELLRMADIVVSMIADSLRLFRKEDPDFVLSMRKRDDHVDLLARELNLYLARNLDSAPPVNQLQMMNMMNFVTDLEAAADVVENQLLELASKKHHLRLEFSNEGWKDLEEISNAVSQIASMSVVCFQKQDADLAAKIVFHKRNIRKLEKRMRESHMSRLVKGTPESVNTSSIHLDVLGEYRRIVGLMSNHVYSLLKDTDRYNIMPRGD
jgi:phosphate:Na+ symporter